MSKVSVHDILRSIFKHVLNINSKKLDLEFEYNLLSCIEYKCVYNFNVKYSSSEIYGAIPDLQTV